MRFTLIFIFSIVCLASLASPMDSLRTEKIDGKDYIIHQVDPQETLFALSRRYNVSVEEIKLNNPVIAGGLKIGDVLRIPIIIKAVNNDNNHIVQQGETLYSISQMYDVSLDAIRNENNLENNALVIGQELIIPLGIEVVQTTFIPKTQLPDTAIYEWHVVRHQETLFGLSRDYNREVAELRRWNGIKDNTINIGDSLIIGYTSKLKVNPVNRYEEIPAAEKDTIPEEKSAAVIASTDKDVEVTRKIVTNESNFEEVVETGLAELIEGSGDTRKYLALHKTAKIGTIIRVHNEMNGQEVFVRVLGRLPDTGVNEKVLLKISQAAYDRIGAIDKRFRVRVSYFPD